MPNCLLVSLSWKIFRCEQGLAVSTSVRNPVSLVEKWHGAGGLPGWAILKPLVFRDRKGNEDILRHVHFLQCHRLLKISAYNVIF